MTLSGRRNRLSKNPDIVTDYCDNLPLNEHQPNIIGKDQVIVITKCFFHNSKGRVLDNIQRHQQKNFWKASASSKASINDGKH